MMDSNQVKKDLENYLKLERGFMAYEIDETLKAVDLLFKFCHLEEIKTIEINGES